MTRPVVRIVAVILALAVSPAASATDPPADLILQLVDDGYDNPVWVGGSGDGSGRIFVVEQPGTIKIVGVGTFLDIENRVLSSPGEQGLLGLVFHPDFANNGYFYVNYTFEQGGQLPDQTRVSRFSVSDTDDDVADAASEVVLLSFNQNAANHNGGDLHFGPDGYLYIATGDGGGSEDQFENAQDLTNPLGKLLRINVDAGIPYAVPGDNPFVNVQDAYTEIWAYGLRNPWRFSFDRANGDLYIGDVGQYEIEEIDRQPAASPGGENYGWSCKEGNVVRNYNPCDGSPLTEPILVYGHGPECAVTGGYVYRGVIGGLHGRYVFGDYCSGRIWFAEDGPTGWTAPEFGPIRGWGLASFGEGDDGELYLTDRDDGEIYRFFSPSAIFTDEFESGDTMAWVAVGG